MCVVYSGFDDAKKNANNSVETKLSSSIGFENKYIVYMGSVLILTGRD